MFQAKIAAAKGAVGLILYTDPNDHATEGDAFTYHHNWWQPTTGVQRRTLPNLKIGVPQTPGHPSKGDILLISLTCELEQKSGRKRFAGLGLISEHSTTAREWGGGGGRGGEEKNSIQVENDDNYDGLTP